MELEKAEAMGVSCFAVDFVQGDQVTGWEAGLVESGRGGLGSRNHCSDDLYSGGLLLRGGLG